MADRPEQQKRCKCGNLIIRAPQFGAKHPTKCIVCAKHEKRKD